MVNQSSQLYVFSSAGILRGIDNLIANPIHEHFAGYLAVLRAQRRNGSGPAKSADITEFHDKYLLSEGAPKESPYIRPFRSRGHGLALFNSNVAGSYAPSSLRTKGKISEVLDVKGSKKSATYELAPNHASIALVELLKSHKIPALSLAAFLYRDYGFNLEEKKVARVLALFRDEFGLRASIPTEHSVFTTLFEDDTGKFQDSDLEEFVWIQ